MTRTLSLLAVAALAACSSAGAPERGDLTPASTVQTGSRADTLSIRVGQSGFADAGRLELRFETRVADSRCPATAICVWMGDAHARIVTRVAGGAARSADLHSALDPRTVAVDRYVITMIGMTPYPGAGQDDATPILIVRVARDGS